MSGSRVYMPMMRTCMLCGATGVESNLCNACLRTSPPLSEFGWASQIAMDAAETIRSLCEKHSRELGTLPMGVVCELALAAIDGLWRGDTIRLSSPPDSDPTTLLASLEDHKARRYFAQFCAIAEAVTKKRRELEQEYEVLVDD